MNILEAMSDPMLFGAHFNGPTWHTWRVLLAAAFGLKSPSADALEIFKRHTGRESWPARACRELWILAGRRGGKSFATALIAVYLACLVDYSRFLAAGERATVMVCASDRRQARTVLRYIRALITENEMLRALVVNETKDGLELSNRVVIETGVSSLRSTRGYSLAAFLADEVSFWSVDSESANADVEVFNAVRPALSTTKGMIVSISSPYARRGVAFETYQRHFREDGFAGAGLERRYREHESDR